jgi:DNA primase
MAKTYIDIVKYMIEARFDISGSVEKPDIIGAIFGQTEGLLGEDLDLRELQKNGKIGRIEIESGSSNNKTYGKLMLPSSLGRVETCIIAAAIESVDRVGPFETVFKVDKVEDTRNEKRSKVIKRAKELVKDLLNNVIPDSKEISELVSSDVKSSTVVTYGPDNLPAGPEIAKSESVILVEGRADVINLLKSDIGNCVAVGGATGKIPKTITDLCAQKEITVFLDGDHGGDMILKSLSNVAEIDYVARAPDGKEVEELTRKEIIKALRSKVPYEQISALSKNGHNHNDDRREFHRQEDRFRRQRGPPQNQPSQEQPSPVLSPSEIANNMMDKRREPDTHPESYEAHGPASQDSDQIEKVQFSDSEQEQQPGEPAKKNAIAPKDEYVNSLKELKNTLRGRLYGADTKMISEIPIRELIQSVQEVDGIDAIVFDGIITQRLIELAYSHGVKAIYGIRASQISRRYDSLLLYTSEAGKI